jgi:hypothetical protein
MTNEDANTLRRINYEEKLNSEITLNKITNADSTVRQTLQTLGNGIARVFSWATKP